MNNVKSGECAGIVERPSDHIGMDETAGIPTAFAPLSGDSDQELQRLENLARDGLEPRHSGIAHEGRAANRQRVCHRAANSEKLECAASSGRS